MMTFRSGRGCQTSMTALQIRRANSTSVPVKLLRGVFKAEVGLGHFVGVLVEQLGPGDSDVHDLVLRHPEDLLPLGKGGGVVEMDHHVLGAFDGLKGFFE